MAKPIRMSALGRDVQVGDIYNYYTDAIFPNTGTPATKECRLTPKCSIFYHQQPDKSYELGINSHLQNSINSAVGLKGLRFVNYPKPLEDDDMAKVDVFIKIVQLTEILDQEFINSKMYEYQLKTCVLATHLVEEVVYGAEFICSMQRKVNQGETKESAEENLFRETKIYFDEFIFSNPMFATPPIKWGNEVYCKIFSSLSKGDQGIEDSFQQSISWLRNKVTNIDKEKLVPVEIFLRYIPEQIETRLRSEWMNDLRTDIDWQWNRIVKESSRISKIATLDRVFPLAKVVYQFHELLTPLSNVIEKIYGDMATESSSDQGLRKLQLIKNLLRDMKDWLTHRRNEIEDICSLLDGTQLVALDLEDIGTRIPNNDEQLVKVLVLKVDYNENPLVDYIQKVVGRQTSVYKIPVFPITKLQENLLDEVRNKLKKFASEANLSGCQNRSTSYYITLVSNSSLDDGTIRDLYFDKASNTMKFGLVSVDDPINSLEKLQQQNPLDGCNLINSMLLPLPLTPIVVPILNQQQIQIGNYEHTSATASPVTTNTISGGRENQMGMNIDASSALSSDSETTDDGSNMVQFSAETKTHPSMQQEHSDKIEIKPNVAAITGNADAEQDLIVNKIEEMKIDDVAEETPSRTASTAADFIQKSSAAAGGKQKVKQRSNSNDWETHVGQSDPKLDRYECGSQSNPERHAKNGSDSSREERNETTTQDGERNRKTTTDKDDTKQVRNYGDKRSGMQHEEIPSNRRVAEIFSDESEQFSTLIKKGRPNVYLLNAEETSTSQDFRWFDIGRSNNFTLPSKNHREHKIIILMGATGCGKSTLINGMVNYILGVKWNDPFRFKCVREDETTAKNQAHSQTSTVTAYTIRHHDGMAVPYSITIIDTPGYGDTRGMDRDRLITRNIHQFLTQQENSVDQIHAACFVAASGDSRLTATQRYIIDSVLSIFGKDVKESMRLLVTFADNAHPPVVEACLAANFPVTSASAGITYSKFNSSVLYANNEQQGDDDFCVDGLFWDMVQVNFTKFFTMLENMNGKDLKSTRNVIQTRGLLEQSLNDIEQELEVCLVKIEMFQRMREYGQRMESDKNVIFEKTEMRLTEMPCPKEFFAYNCHRCRNTCERPIKLKYSERLQKRRCEFCTCPASEHNYQQFEWRLTPVKITTTLKDMKAEYESNYDRKVSVEQLLADNLEELNLAKAEVLRLLEQVGISARLLDLTALRSNALTPSDYLSLMKSRVSEEQAPGYQTRLETLTELQNCLAADASASASHKTASNIPNQTQHRSSNTGGASHRGNWGSKTSQHGNADDYWLASTTTAGVSNYSSGYNTRAASGSGLNQSDINQSAVTRRGTAENANQKLKHGSDSREGYSSDDNKDKKGFVATVKGIFHK